MISTDQRNTIFAIKMYEKFTSFGRVGICIVSLF